MFTKTINDKNQTLFNINKIKEEFENKYIFSIMPSIKEDIDKDLDLSSYKSQTNIKEEEKNESNSFRKSMINIKISNKNSSNPLNTLVNEEDSHKNIHKNFSSSNGKDFKIEKKIIKPFNLKNISKSKSIKFMNFTNNNLSKFSLYKNKPNINDIEIEKEEEMPTKLKKIFSTEIYLDNTNTKENTKVNIDANINTNSNNNYQNKKKSKRNLSLDNNSSLFNKKEEDPLLIPKEDMIFEEIKKYKCFKYFTKDELDKTGVPFIYIKMNMNPNKTINTKEKNKSLDKSLNDTRFLKKLLKTGKDKVFLSKRNNKDITDERKKEILENVYRIKTAPDFYKRIKTMKGKKDKKKLKNYQNNFLKIVKYNISNKYYESLKDKFSEIREVAEGKYSTNDKFIKEIEKNEENTINNINEICSRYKRFFATKNINKLFIKSIGPRLKLPKINFVQIAKRNFLSESKKSNNKLKKKRNLINLKKNLINGNNPLNKDSIQSSQNKDILFSATNYKKFNIFKSLNNNNN